MITALKQNFSELTKKYSTNTHLIETLWNEISFKYSEESRHYHTLSHIDSLLNFIHPVKTKINNWDTILYAAYYHDIVYDPTSNANEENSAEIAKQNLTAISFPATHLEKCISLILATKKHTITNDSDTDYFTDADLAILGQRKEIYEQYAIQVRMEYSVFPDAVYNPGRKKVLTHFLEMDRIFKTDHFFDNFEKQARINLMTELEKLCLIQE